MEQAAPPETVAHTVVGTAPDGTPHVQKFGAAHVVEGSVKIIELAPGETVLIRHLA